MLLQWMPSFDNKLLHQLDFQDEQLVIVRTSNVVGSSHGRADSVSSIVRLCISLVILMY